jgi:hypothetical protein
MNILEEDSFALIKNLIHRDVRFILVGGHAVNYHGYSRTTGDVDIWLEDTSENRSKFVEALEDYGISGADYYLQLPLIAGYSEILLDDGMYFDPMSELKKFKQADFQECYKSADEWQPEPGLVIKVLNINQLIEEKQVLNRLKDKDDVEHLKFIRNRSNNP